MHRNQKLASILFKKVMISKFRLLLEVEQSEMLEYRGSQNFESFFYKFLLFRTTFVFLVLIQFV